MMMQDLVKAKRPLRKPKRAPLPTGFGVTVISTDSSVRPPTVSLEKKKQQDAVLALDLAGQEELLAAAAAPDVDGKALLEHMEAYPESALGRDRYGNSALHWLCLNRSLTQSVLQDFLAPHGIERVGPPGNLWASVNNSRNLAMHYLCGNQNVNPAMIKLLHKRYPTAVRQKHGHGSLPLHVLCKNSHALRASVLEEAINCWPQSVTSKDAQGFTPLHLVCSYEVLAPTTSTSRRQSRKRQQRYLVGQEQQPEDNGGSAGQGLARKEGLGDGSPEEEGVGVGDGDEGESGDDDDDDHLVEMSTQMRLRESITTLLDWYPEAANDKRCGTYPLHFLCKNKSLGLGTIQVYLEWWPRAVSDVDDIARDQPLHVLSASEFVSPELLADYFKSFPTYDLCASTVLVATTTSNGSGLTPLHILLDNPACSGALLKVYLDHASSSFDNGSSSSSNNNTSPPNLSTPSPLVNRNNHGHQQHQRPQGNEKQNNSRDLRSPNNSQSSPRRNNISRDSPLSRSTHHSPSSSSKSVSLASSSAISFYDAAGRSAFTQACSGIVAHRVDTITQFTSRFSSDTLAPKGGGPSGASWPVHALCRNIASSSSLLENNSSMSSTADGGLVGGSSTVSTSNHSEDSNNADDAGDDGSTQSNARSNGSDEKGGSEVKSARSFFMENFEAAIESCPGSLDEVDEYGEYPLHALCGNQVLTAWPGGAVGTMLASCLSKCPQALFQHKQLTKAQQHEQRQQHQQQLAMAALATRGKRAVDVVGTPVHTPGKASPTKATTATMRRQSPLLSAVKATRYHRQYHGDDEAAAATIPLQVLLATLGEARASAAVLDCAREITSSSSYLDGEKGLSRHSPDFSSRSLLTALLQACALSGLLTACQDLMEGPLRLDPDATPTTEFFRVLEPRSPRQIGIASHIDDVHIFFRLQGSFLGRYQLHFPPAHESPRCVVFRATDLDISLRRHLRDVKARQQSAHGRQQQQQQQHQQHPHNSLKKNKEKKAGTLSRELPWKKKRDRNLSSNKGIDFQDDDDGLEESDQVCIKLMSNSICFRREVAARRGSSGRVDLQHSSNTTTTTTSSSSSSNNNSGPSAAVYVSRFDPRYGCPLLGTSEDTGLYYDDRRTFAAEVQSLGFPGYVFGLFMPWCGAWTPSAASAGDLSSQTSVLLPPFSPTTASAADLAPSSSSALSSSLVHSLLLSSPPPVSMVAMPRTLDQIVRHERLVQFQEEVRSSSSQGSSVPAPGSVSTMFSQMVESVAHFHSLGLIHGHLSPRAFVRRSMPLPKASPPPSLMSPSLASSSVPFLSSSSALPLSPIPISTSSSSTKQNGEQQVHVSHLLDHNRQNSNHENRLVAIDFGASRHIATHSMVRRVKAAAYLSSEGAERENDSLASCLTPAFDGNKPLASAYSCPPEAFYCLQNENEVRAHKTSFNLTATTSVPPSLPPSLLGPSLANGFDGHDGGDKDDDSECGNVEVLSFGQTETNGVLRGAQSEIESTATLSRAIKESAKSLGGYAAQEARDGRWFAVRSAFPHSRTGSNDHNNQNHSSPDEHDPDVHSTHLHPPERVASTLNLPYDPLTASVASDVWALGCILFFLASGGQPLVPTDPRDECCADGDAMALLADWDRKEREEEAITDDSDAHSEGVSTEEMGKRTPIAEVSRLSDTEHHGGGETEGKTTRSDGSQHNDEQESFDSETLSELWPSIILAPSVLSPSVQSRCETVGISDPVTLDLLSKLLDRSETKRERLLKEFPTGLNDGVGIAGGHSVGLLRHPFFHPSTIGLHASSDDKEGSSVLHHKKIVDWHALILSRAAASSTTPPQPSSKEPSVILPLSEDANTAEASAVKENTSTFAAAKTSSELPLTPAANNTIRVDTPLVADIGELSRAETGDGMFESPSLSQQLLQERPEQADVVATVTDERTFDAEDVNCTNGGDADDNGHLSGIVICDRDAKGSSPDNESSPSVATSKEPSSVNYTHDESSVVDKRTINDAQDEELRATAVTGGALDGTVTADMNLDALIEDPVGSFLLRCGLFHHRQGFDDIGVDSLEDALDEVLLGSDDLRIAGLDEAEIAQFLELRNTTSVVVAVEGMTSGEDVEEKRGSNATTSPLVQPFRGASNLSTAAPESALSVAAFPPLSPVSPSFVLRCPSLPPPPSPPQFPLEPPQPLPSQETTSSTAANPVGSDTGLGNGLASPLVRPLANRNVVNLQVNLAPAPALSLLTAPTAAAIITLEEATVDQLTLQIMARQISELQRDQAALRAQILSSAK